MTVRIDALTTGLVPQEAITWWLLDINTLQYNTVGAWSLVLPATVRNWQLINFDGQGEFKPVAILVDWNGVFQVPLLAEEWEHDLNVDPNTGTIFETITLSGADFLALLGNRVCYPDGTKDWSAQTTIPQTYSGPAETVIKTLVKANLVNAGNTDRIVPNFTVATDQGRGGNVTYTVTPPLPQSGSNGLTGDSAGFEGSIGTWTATNATITRSTAHFHSGTHSAILTATSAGNVQANSCAAASILTQGLQVLPGDSVAASVWFRADNGGTARTCNVGVQWYDDTGTSLETDFNNGPVDKTTGWVQASSNFAAPDNAAFGRLLAQVQNCANGEIHYIDDASFTDNGSSSSSSTSTANLGDTLMDMVRAVAAQTPVGVQITLSGTNLVFDCYIPRDLSGEAVFSPSLGNLRGDTISDATPTADVVLLEDGAATPNFTRVEASGDAVGDPWRYAEMFDDQTSTTKSSDLSAAATSDLQQGASVHQLTITATDIPLLRFGKDASPVQGYGLGDTVTVAIREGVSYTDIVTAVELTAGSQSGSVYMGSTAGVQISGSSFGTYYELVTPTIGTPSASATDQTATSKLTALVRKIDKAITRARKAGQ